MAWLWKELNATPQNTRYYPTFKVDYNLQTMRYPQQEGVVYAVRATFEKRTFIKDGRNVQTAIEYTKEAMMCELFDEFRMPLYELRLAIYAGDEATCLKHWNEVYGLMFNPHHPEQTV